MAHNSSCAQAEGPECTCTCGGARHGCQGGFDLADKPIEKVLEYVAEREEEWRSLPKKQAAIGCARATVISWLHRDVHLLSHTRAAEQRAFENDARQLDQGLFLRVLEAELGPLRMAEFQSWAGESHFWCELLAQLAFALSRYEHFWNTVAYTVERALLGRDDVPVPPGLEPAGPIGIAAHASWRYLHEGLITASGAFDPQALIWPARVIAVLMCPDASNHPAVREHCLAPILQEGRAEAGQEVRDRLSRTFTEDPWFA
ncbi:hypothetical protein GCM10022221_26640 [Actinocorallia aurea]